MYMQNPHPGTTGISLLPFLVVHCANPDLLLEESSSLGDDQLDYQRRGCWR
jgi:hypothetical protein